MYCFLVAETLTTLTIIGSYKSVLVVRVVTVECWYLPLLMISLDPALRCPVYAM